MRLRDYFFRKGDYIIMISKGSFKISNKEFKAKKIKVDYESLASEDSGRTDFVVLADVIWTDDACYLHDLFFVV